jgi:SAM-dependent methyltransferase
MKNSPFEHDTAGYSEDPALPGYWLYGGLRIQADVETHIFVTDFVRKCLLPSSRVLDVAAGQGALAQQLLDLGICVSVTTWNNKCCLAIPQYRIDLDQPFGLADVGGEPYDLVCCIEIIEHLENPARFLRDCATLLAPSSLLLLSTPNVESAPARIQWLLRGCPLIFSEGEIKNNRHISMMWRQGLEHLVDLAGFKVVERHLLGSPRLQPSLRSVAKWLVYQMMYRALGPETRGTTRAYVLRRLAYRPRRQGPDEVY